MILIAIIISISYNDEGTENINTISLEKKIQTFNVYMESVPVEVSTEYLFAVNDAFEFWKQYHKFNYNHVNSESEANLIVQWVKEFGGEPIGQTYYDRQFVQVGLGDSNCMGVWRPYTYETVLNIATHELGHVLGEEHTDDPNDIMYRTLTTKYETDFEITDVLPDGWVRFYPVCTKNSVTEYSFQVTSGEPLNIYIVPSRGDYELLTAGKQFSHYPSCQATETRFYSINCDMTVGSGIILQNPSTFGLGADAQFTVTAREM